MSNVSIIQEGPGIRSFQYKPDGVQLLTVTNILEGSVDLHKTRKYISETEYYEKYSHFQVNMGDIVCACSGGSWGKSAIYGVSDYKIILNTSTLRLRFFGDLADNGYLYMMTKTFLFKKQLSDQLSGMQPNFGYAHYSKILIPFPPLKEQVRIVYTVKKMLKGIEGI
ncbi:MAG: restriction endonuclease subunit S [Muribaculaceae bacterium]|nr:restriction endonuclease subunit S [Muribaculaceae bacterium]